VKAKKFNRNLIFILAFILLVLLASFLGFRLFQTQSELKTLKTQVAKTTPSQPGDDLLFSPFNRNSHSEEEETQPPSQNPQPLIDPFAQMQKMREEMQKQMAQVLGDDDSFFDDSEEEDNPWRSPLHQMMKQFPNFGNQLEYKISESPEEMVVKIKVKTPEDTQIKYELQSQFLSLTLIQDSKEEKEDDSGTQTKSSYSQTTQLITLPTEGDPNQIKEEKEGDSIVLRIKKLKS